MCKKNFIPISICFCVITLQIYREILKKNRKRAITLEKKQFFKNLRKPFLDIHIRNGMPKFESSTIVLCTILETDLLAKRPFREAHHGWWSAGEVENLQRLLVRLPALLVYYVAASASPWKPLLSAGLQKEVIHILSSLATITDLQFFFLKY